MCDMEQCGSCVVRQRQVSGPLPTEDSAEDPPPVDEDAPPPATEDSSADEDAPAVEEAPAEGDAPPAWVLGEAAAAKKAFRAKKAPAKMNRSHKVVVDPASYAADTRALGDEASALLIELSQDHRVTAGVQVVVTDPRIQSRRLLADPDEPPTEPATGEHT